MSPSRARRVTGHTTTRGVTVRPNKIKQMWRDGRYVTLGWLSVSHGFTAEVMARQGFDALCVDMQHGTTDMSAVGPMRQAIWQTDRVRVVGAPWTAPATIMKALDLGAYAIIVPLINTADDAAKAVAACRYPPVGMRSSGPVRAVHYAGADYIAKANDEIVVMAMIETKEGLANLDAICATKGLDAVYIGPADLSFALGLPPGRRMPGGGGLRAAGATAVRHHQGRWRRQRLHLSRREPPVDVHRHVGGRDRHRSHRLRAPADGDDVRRRDPEGHQPADQVRGLQPTPLPSHRRGQAPQRRRPHLRPAQTSPGRPGRA